MYGGPIVYNRHGYHVEIKEAGSQRPAGSYGPTRSSEEATIHMMPEACRCRRRDSEGSCNQTAVKSYHTATVFKWSRRSGGAGTLSTV